MKFRDLRIVLTEDTKIELVIVDWRNGSTRELLPKPVTKNDDALQGFGRYIVTGVEPLDYEYVKVYLDAGVKGD